MSRSVGELIEAADLNGLLAVVDGLTAGREWDDLIGLAEMCEEAVDRGKQLWPIAAHIDYRLALEAPPAYAASVLGSVAARWSHGPLTEVAASRHSWNDLVPFIDEPQIAAYVAQERVLRGENLAGDKRAHKEILELPLRLSEWEPVYCLPIFAADHVEVPEVWEPRAAMRPVARRTGEELDEPEVVGALLDLVTPWTTESNGAARAVVVEGDAIAAVSILTYDSFLIGPLTTAEALQRVSWAAANGGAHGRRRGGAFGRLAAWNLGSMLADLPWPVGEETLGSSLHRLRWWRWDEDPGDEGWRLRLAVSDESNGWAAAVAATDVLTLD